MNKRITQWSSLKGALMIVVVMGHFCQLYAWFNQAVKKIENIFICQEQQECNAQCEKEIKR